MSSSTSAPTGSTEDTANGSLAKEEAPAGNDASKTDISGDIDPSNEVQGTKLILIHLSICLCTFLVGLDFNLIATAVPVITSEFNSTRDIGWYGAAFMVALCTTQPLAGKMYTLFPKKLTYLVYIFFFELGSLVCALAPSSRALIAGRVVAGFGASGIFAGGFTILTTIIPLHKRAVWTGVMGSTFSIASIVGPVLGGALTQNVTWRWCFYINLPIGGAAAAVFFALVHLKAAPTELQPVKEKLKNIDGPGLVLFAGSITMLLLALQWGGVEYPWSSSVVVGLFVGFGVVFILFVVWTIRRGDGALIPPRIFTVNRNPALLCTAAFFVNGPFQTIIYWLPVWFQGVLGSSPTTSGVNFFPTVIADVLAAFIGSALASQLGWWNPFVILGSVTVCLGGGLLTTIYPDISGSHWVGYQILGGVGYSLSSNLSHLAMQTSLPQDLVPLGASTLLSIISTSCAIFAAVGQAVFQKQLQVNLGPVISQDFVDKIIDSGVTDLNSLVDPGILRTVVEKYSLSVTQVFYIPAVAPVVAFFLLLGCKWISTKSKQTPAAAVELGEKNANVERGADV
ncbi:putative Major facilitator superfamily (MFS) profile domain-containing protein [Seiridium cardinale]|uniref:Major facilitator superfamily (MFS) profile domain-containing protein n=1 Tax=Seiridium cardinale TaxID=138064 RepID=A0ABR2XGK2_9PEZI